MRIHAYVLAGDPAWAAESIRSYYGLVDRIIVSHDRGKRSWSGHPMRVDAALAAIRSADPDGKVSVVVGDHSDPDTPVLTVETAQRQHALDAASEGSDVVLQLDTDEVVMDAETLQAHVVAMQTRGAIGLEYPLRDFYTWVGRGRYLERCHRSWRTQAAYPGPVAVISGATLAHCRQSEGELYRVDVRPTNTDPWHPRTAPVHAVVPPASAIAHLSWVRTEEDMELKSSTSGYASSRDWEADLTRWRRRARHPHLTAAMAPITRDAYERFRITRLPFGPPQ
ncbi:hypothetical protein [Janibacter sp. G1551]|uniref:hypothetical protein n=1 Tax=Janibacter sp. G1551 TaxID=3420440 RepID=UPI003CFD5931